MKKFFAVAALVLGIFLAQISAADAREVFAYSETRNGETSNHYVITESIQPTSYGFKVRLHAVGVNFSYDKYWELGFMLQNDDLYAVLLPGSYTVQVTRGDTILKDFWWQVFRVAAENK